ncbi:ribosome biogenesis GTPase Der [candidate division WOR-3 bacterium]|nr:ribosome biogenesis GTPase Der [candidate division WOR-3 bacterium]
MSRPVVALVGRTNVGKSTLLNRLLGSRLVVVDDRPHVTRDRVVVPFSHEGRNMLLVDTGGWAIDAQTPLDAKVSGQAELAMRQADVIVLVVDVRDGVIAADEEVAELVRKSGKAAMLVVNKVDAPHLEPAASDFHRLGIGPVVALSAMHNRGIDEFRDALVELLPPPVDTVAPPSDAVRIAIVGRPNAGKSTLLNALLGDERAIVDATPGTTRDSLDAEMQWQGKKLILVDTAGIRRKSRVEYGIDYFSILRSMQSIERADVVLLVIEATEPATSQDITIARYVLDSGRGLCIVVNKWDLVPPELRERHKNWMKQRLEFLSWVPVLRISALHNRHVKQTLHRALEVWEARRQQLSRSVVDEAVKEAVDKQPPPRVGTRRLDIVWAHQDEEKPWQFVLHVNDPQLIVPTYQRYLEHQLRERFGFRGVPVHLVFVRAGRRKKRRKEP